MSDSASSTPPTPPEPPVVPPSPPAAGTGLQPPVAAGLACFFLLLGGIVFLVLEKKDKFVRFYAMQSVFVGGAGVMISIFLKIAGMILGLIPVLGKVILFLIGIVSMLAGLGLLVIWVIMIVKAFSYREWEVPFLGPLARKQLESGTPGSV